VHEDKGSQHKVEIAYGVGVVLLKLVDGGMSAGSDAIMDCGKISWALLKLADVGG